MSFRMRPEVSDWFKHIFKQGPIQTKFDIYYFCLVMGLASRRSETPSNSEEFVQYFVSEYRPVQRLILGLLIISEMGVFGYELEDRKEIQGLLNKYLDPNDPAHLTEAGFARMNDYANAGFNLIVQTLESKPYHVETFLQWFAKEVSRRIEQDSEWKTLSEK